MIRVGRSLVPAAALVGCGAGDPPAPGTDTGTTVAHPFADHPFFAPGFRNVAHRGGAALRPEETIVAFEHGLAVGADVLETDVWATADGVLVLLHDQTVDRTTDGTGAIGDLTWDQVRALDAGYWFTEDGGATWPWRGAGVGVARLDEAIAAFPGVPWAIEIKQRQPSIVDALLAALDAAGALDRVALFSFYDDALAEVRARRPDVLTAMGTAEMLAFWEADEATYAPPAYYMEVPLELGLMAVDAELVDRGHRFGVAMHVWTVNDPDQMQEVIGWGADGIITDDPLALAGVAP